MSLDFVLSNDFFSTLIECIHDDFHFREGQNDHLQNNRTEFHLFSTKIFLITFPLQFTIVIVLSILQTCYYTEIPTHINVS